MLVRAERIGRALAITAVSLGVAGCYEELRSPRMLTADPVVMGISLAVIEDGPYADGIAAMPLDRPRAEVLPLDTIELDALVANVDGVVDLGDAAWVLCGDGCLPSIEQQGAVFGELPPCHEGSGSEGYACLAGRGARPRLVLPDLTPPESTPLPRFVVFPRVAVVVGGPEGPTTDECLEQLVLGPREDLWGCGIGASDIPYGPDWALQRLLEPVGLGFFEQSELPPVLSELLPPNAAARVEQVRIGRPQDFLGEEPREPPPRSIDEVIEVEAGEVVIEPVISVRDQQISLRYAGPNQWLGQPDGFVYEMWADRLEPGRVAQGLGVDRLNVFLPAEPGPVRVYVVVTDSRRAVSWFWLDLQVIER